MGHPIDTIECPNCGHEINVSKILYTRLDEELSKKYNDELARHRKKYDEQKTSLENERRKLEDRIEEGIRSESLKLRKMLREEAEREQSERIQAMQEELERKAEKLKEYNRALSEIERLKREKEQVHDEIEAESEKKLTRMVSEERERIRKAEQERIELKVTEKDALIEQLKNQLGDAQRKAEQGSTQLQGEAQELAIEEWLRDSFPLDTIEEIKKGKKGADCLQIVNTRSRRGCGTIYYESKRTRVFQPKWIEKFKGDIQDRGADVGVLVTETMPPDMERMGSREGVWICSFEEFKGLCTVVREFIVRMSSADLARVNRDDKMGMLYDFLTSNEFRLQVEAIVEGFTQLQQDMESEKRSMNAIWKRREKQIQKVVKNTVNMYSSVKGIAGSAVQHVPLLELPEGEPDPT
jgi:hypothetical protein